MGRPNSIRARRRARGRVIAEIRNLGNGRALAAHIRSLRTMTFQPAPVINLTPTQDGSIAAFNQWHREMQAAMATVLGIPERLLSGSYI